MYTAYPLASQLNVKQFPRTNTPSNKGFKVAFRQPLTESNQSMTEAIQTVMDALKSLGAELIFGDSAKSGDTFKQEYEKKSGKPFTPYNFREARLGGIQESDLFIFLRPKDVLSESGSFETGYIYARKQLGLPMPPVLILQEKGSEIKTTLIREMEGATYMPYDPKNIQEFVEQFKAKVLPEVEQYRDARNAERLRAKL